MGVVAGIALVPARVAPATSDVGASDILVNPTLGSLRQDAPAPVPAPRVVCVDIAAEPRRGGRVRVAARRQGSWDGKGQRIAELPEMQSAVEQGQISVTENTLCPAENLTPWAAF